MIEFGIEWQAVEKLGVYRRTVADNGIGMTADELCRYFKTLGVGSKPIGGVHENFGVGARIASLPWNQEGVVVISYKGGKAAMIWIVLDVDSGEYQLVEFKTEKGMTAVVDPSRVTDENGIDWGLVRPGWMGEHGTVIVLLGTKTSPDTVLGNPSSNEGETKALSGYLNTRFWQLDGADVKVVELRSSKKNQWPRGADDKDDARRPNTRSIMGAKYYLKDIPSPKAKLCGNDVLLLDGERVVVEWYLWSGERPEIHSYAKQRGYIAFRYKDELFGVTERKLDFRCFGIGENRVQQNLTIILEPQHYYGNSSGQWGVHPDQSRSHLIFTGSGERGGAIPLAEWGGDFMDHMPELIMNAILEARGETSGSMDDEEYRKRLQEKFGKRFTIRALVQAPHATSEASPSKTTAKSTSFYPEGPRGEVRRKRHQARHVMMALPGGNSEGIERDVPVDIPSYRFVGKEEFDLPFHLAAWTPNDPKGPTVLLNQESLTLQESIKHHQEQYADIYAEEVAKTVMAVFGELAVCKIAHSQKLAQDVSEQDLDQNYRSEAALTVSLMGLMAEDALIAQRLRKLGQKKSETETGEHTK